MEGLADAGEAECHVLAGIKLMVRTIEYSRVRLVHSRAFRRPGSAQREQSSAVISHRCHEVPDQSLERVHLSDRQHYG